MLVQLKMRKQIMRRNLKKLVKLMEYYLMPSKNLVTMLVKIWIVRIPVRHIHLGEVLVNPWMQRKCSKPFLETETTLECIMLFIITLVLEVIMATCPELSSNFHRNSCIHTASIYLYHIFEVHTNTIRFLQNFWPLFL